LESSLFIFFLDLIMQDYQLIDPTKNLISLHPQKQQNNVLNQYTKYSTPTSSSSKVLFEQQKEKNKTLLLIDNTSSS